jgi:hypothetical protein
VFAAAHALSVWPRVPAPVPLPNLLFCLRDTSNPLTCAREIDDYISRGAADFVDRLKIANHPFMLLKTSNPVVMKG